MGFKIFWYPLKHPFKTMSVTHTDNVQCGWTKILVYVMKTHSKTRSFFLKLQAQISMITTLSGRYKIYYSSGKWFHDYMCSLLLSASRILWLFFSLFFRLHIYKNHTENSQYTCQSCSQDFYDLKKFVLHQIKIHAERNGDHIYCLACRRPYTKSHRWVKYLFTTI